MSEQNPKTGEIVESVESNEKQTKLHRSKIKKPK